MSWKIRHDTEGRRFVADIDGAEATISYEIDHGTYDLLHTFVPEALRGKGVADELARQTLAWLQAEGQPFRLTCPFLHSYGLRHPKDAVSPAHSA
jgi:predicted GNAT family acetyltransferase